MIGRDDQTQAWAHQDSLEESYVRHELARAAELAAKAGGCPERAHEIELGLLHIAGLERFDLAA